MSFVYTVNPNGGVVYKRAVEVPFSKSHLLERILSAENIRRAWKQVRAKSDHPFFLFSFCDSFHMLLEFLIQKHSDCL